MAAAVAGVLAFGGFAATAQPVKAAEYHFSVVVTKVWVNQSGGITIEGTADCTAALTDAGLVGPVYASVRWDASQTVGRNRVVTAGYDPGIAFECDAATSPWFTRYPYPVGTIQWVYSTNGRFTTGRIHVEIFGEAHPADGVDFYAFDGFDLKATRYR
jgi:hypothetical protein